MPDDTTTITASVSGRTADKVVDQWSFGAGKYRFLANISAMGIIAIAFMWFLQDKFQTARSDTAYYQTELAAMRKAFDDRLNKLEDAQDKRVARQWENQMKMAEGLNSVAIALARIEALLHVKPEARPAAPASEPPKPIQLKPPA